MGRFAPPFSQSKYYFNFDYKRWIAHNRPSWKTAQVNQTIDTIWDVSQDVQAHYEAHFLSNPEAPTTPGIPHPHHIPSRPFTAAQSRTAKRTGRLPIDPGAAQGANPALAAQAVPTAAQAPAAQPAPAAAHDSTASQGATSFHPSAAPQVSAASHAPAESQAPPVAPIDPPIAPPDQYVDQYPFDFWPQQPWDAEPEDRCLDLTLKDIKNSSAHQRTWQDSGPQKWPIGNEENYRGARFLGAGSYGCAGLWCLVNDEGVIIDRVVLKEARPNKRMWRDPINWCDRVPREIRIHQKIDANRDAANGLHHDTLVKHTGYRLMMAQRRYRLYLEFYEGGDVYEALSDQFTDNRGYAKDEGYWGHMKTIGWKPPLVPESLIWHIIKSLVTACQILHSGQAGDSGLPVAKWRPITHCDINRTNMFLQPPPKGTNDYPKVVLGDFGLSFFDNHQPGTTVTHANPSEYTLDQLDGRYAPELQFARGNIPTRIGEKTDVWQIGAIIHYLLANGMNDSNHGPERYVRERDVPEGQPVERIAGERGDLGFMRIRNEAEAKDIFNYKFFKGFETYSLELKDLAAHCLNWNPGDRPTLLEMRNTIDGMLDRNPQIRDGRGLGPFQRRVEDEFILGDYLP